jgi:hypothetical protein
MLRLIGLFLGTLWQVATVLLHLSIEFVQDVHFPLAPTQLRSKLLRTSHDLQGLLLETLDLLGRMTFIVSLELVLLVNTIEVRSILG